MKSPRTASAWACLALVLAWRWPRTWLCLLAFGLACSANPAHAQKEYIIIVTGEPASSNEGMAMMQSVGQRMLSYGIFRDAAAVWAGNADHALALYLNMGLVAKTATAKNLEDVAAAYMLKATEAVLNGPVAGETADQKEARQAVALGKNIVAALANIEAENKTFGHDAPYVFLTQVSDLITMAKRILARGDRLTLLAAGKGTGVATAVYTALPQIDSSLDMTKLQVVNLSNYYGRPFIGTQFTSADDPVARSFAAGGLLGVKLDGVLRCTDAICLASTYGPDATRPLHRLYFSTVAASGPNNTTMYDTVMKALVSPIEARIQLNPMSFTGGSELLKGAQAVLSAQLNPKVNGVIASQAWTDNGATITFADSATVDNKTALNTSVLKAGTHNIVYTVVTKSGRTLSVQHTLQVLAPDVTSVVPSSAEAGSTQAIVVSGTDLPTATKLSVAGKNCVPRNYDTARAYIVFNCEVPTTLGSHSVTISFENGGTHDFGPVVRTLNVVAPVPAVTGFSLFTGTAGSDVVIAVLGRNLPASLALVLTGQGACTLQGINTTATQASFSCTLTTPGSARLNVLATAGGSPLMGGAGNFIVDAPPPAVESISPRSGLAGSTVAVTVTGSNLPATTHLSLTGQGACTPSTETATASQITYTCALSTPGTWSASVRRSANGSEIVLMPSHFTVNAAPAITAADVLSGEAGSQVSVTLSGTALPSTLVMSISNQGNCTAVSRTDQAARFSCGLTLAGSQTLEARWTAQDTTPAFTSAFTVRPGVPVVSGVSPRSGLAGNTVGVTVSGSNLPSGLQLELASQGPCVPSTETASAERVSFSCTLTSGGSSLVMVRGADHTLIPSGNLSFEVGQAVPLVQGLDPTSGQAGTTINVAVTGSGLPNTLNLVLAGQGSCTRATTGLSASRVSFSCALTTPGVISASIRDAQNVLLPGGLLDFTVTPYAPSVTMISPTFGNVGSTARVNISGSNLPLSLVLTLEGQPACVAVSRTEGSASFDCPLTSQGSNRISLWSDVYPVGVEIAVPSTFGAFDVLP